MSRFHIFCLYPLNNILPGVYQTRDIVGGSQSLHQRPSSLSAVQPMAARSRHCKSQKGGTSKINHRPRQAELQYQPGIPSSSPAERFRQRPRTASHAPSRAPTPRLGGFGCCLRISLTQLRRPKPAVELLFSHAQLCSCNLTSA